MASEEFIIEIGVDGRVSVRPQNVKADRCKHWAEVFETIVGREESRIFTSEHYQTHQRAAQNQELKQRR